MNFRIEHVHFMPKELQPGILYVARKFGTAAHVCACGCGAKVRTPLAATEWNLKETKDGPTLYPSIGNWQQACQSHYWIIKGEVKWSYKWTEVEIAHGRKKEEIRRQAYYDSRDHDNASGTVRTFRRFLNYFGKK